MRIFQSLLFLFLLHIGENLESKIEPKVNAEFESPRIQWYQPDIEPTNDRSPTGLKILKVRFIGKIRRRSKIQIGEYTTLVGTALTQKKLSAKLLILPNNQLGTVRSKLQSGTVAKSGGKSLGFWIDPDVEGYFSFSMRLPEASIVVPLTLIIGKKTYPFQLEVTLKNGRSNLSHHQLLNRPCHNCVWLGLGLGLLDYRHTVSANPNAIEHTALTIPNLSIRASVKVADRWALRADYHKIGSPDRISETSTVSASKPLSWTYYGLEAEYMAFSKMLISGIAIFPSLLIGIQDHRIPLAREASGQKFSIDEFHFKAITIGGSVILLPNDKWQFEYLLRWQVPVKNTDEVELKTGLSFDSSTGVIYHMAKHWKLALFWTGQYHVYKHRMNQTENSFTLVSTQLDFNLGYQF